MRFAYVNPADTTDIQLEDINGTPFETGRFVVTARIPAGWTLTDRAVPEWDVYDIVPDPANPPPPTDPYYGETRTRAFSGVVNDAAAAVVETIAYPPIELDELRRQKETDLNNYAGTVYFSAFEHIAGPLEFWVVNDNLAQFTRASYSAYLLMRGMGILFDAVDAGIADGGGTNAEVATFWTTLKAAQENASTEWWSRDIRVYLYDQVTLGLVTDLANQSQWDGLMNSWGTFSWQTRAATNRVQDDITAAYGDGTGVPGGPEWQALAAIDVTDDVAYNWPTHYSGPLPDPTNGAQILTIEQLLDRVSGG